MDQPSRNTLILSNLTPPVLILAILTFCGFVLFVILTLSVVEGEESDLIPNKLLILGLSMILGPLGFLFLLSTLSYFFKGKWGILGIFSLYFFSCLYFYIKRIYQPLSIKIIPKLTLKNIVFSLILIIYLGILFLFTHRAYVGSDADMYWAIATSFAKGNYPIYQSWQPQFLTVYHQGTFMIEGAINLLSKSRIELIHYIFSFYILTSIFIFLLGLVKRSLFSFLIPIIAVFLIGPVFLLLNYPGSYKNFSSLSFPQTIPNLSRLPDFNSFQGANGAGAVDLQGLIYTNFYTFGLAAFLVFIYFLKNNFISLILLALLASIDETFFLAGVPLFLLSVIARSLQRSNLDRIFTFTGLLRFARNDVWKSIFFLIILLIVIQNPIRDSLLTPSPEFPRFKLLLEMDNPLPWFYHIGEPLNWNGVAMGQTASSLAKSKLDYASFRKIEVNNTTWGILDLKVLIILLYLSIFLTKLYRNSYNKMVLSLTTASLISFIISLFIINTFWPPNAGRIVNQAYHLAFIALGIQIVNFFNSNLKLRVLALVFLVLFIPQILASHFKILDQLHLVENNFTKVKKDTLLESISRSIPPNKVTIYLDRYPTHAPHSYYNYTSLAHFGVFVPIGPKDVKILNPNPGIEFLDAVNNLSPKALDKLRVEYVYIQDASYFRLSHNRADQIKNPDYFQFISRFENDGNLYKVLDNFKKITDEEDTLSKMIDIIGSNKRIYLDKLKLTEVRKSLILTLAKQNTLMGPMHAHGGDFYMYIETILPFEESTPQKAADLDYLLLDPQKEPLEFSQKFTRGYTRILENPYVSLWKKL